MESMIKIFLLFRLKNTRQYGFILRMMEFIHHS